MLIHNIFTLVYMCLSVCVLPRWDGSAVCRHRDSLRPRAVQVILSINSKRVFGREGHQRWGAWEIDPAHLHLPTPSSPYGHVVMMTPGNGCRGRPEGSAGESVALSHDSSRLFGSALRPVQLPPLLQGQDGIGRHPCAVDQEALLARARRARVGAHRPGLRFRDRSGDERVGEVHPSADTALSLTLAVGLGHPVKVHHITEAERAEVQPRVLLLIRVLNADAQLHVISRPRSTIVFPFPHDALARSRGRVVEIALDGTHCAYRERERDGKITLIAYFTVKIMIRFQKGTQMIKI